MKCQVAREWISESANGTLDENRMKKLRAHLDGCRDCRELAHDFASIAQGAKSLKSLEPSEMVWLKIAAEVKSGPREVTRTARKKWAWLWPTISGRPTAWVYAAAALVFIFAGAFLIHQRPWSAPGIAKDRSIEFTLAKLQEAQDYYEKAIQALSDAVKQQGRRLDPRLAEVFSRNLAAMDETIQACRQIVRQDPDNLTARAYLLTAYREKVNFLEEIMGVSRLAAQDKNETIL